MNAVFSNSAKIEGSYPYLKEACRRANSGCIFMTFADHLAEQVNVLLGKVHTVLMWDFSLPDFFFARDTLWVKILVTGVLLADTGRAHCGRSRTRLTIMPTMVFGWIWRIPTPGLIMVGRSNILGSIHAMKSSGQTTYSVKFIVEKSAASDAALRSSRHCLRSGN